MHTKDNVITVTLTSRF